MSSLTLTLLGAPRIALDGSNLHIQRRKAVALLAYLAVTQTPHRRDVLATLFWSDFDQTGARDNLRRTLSALHQALHLGWLEIDRATVRLPARAGLWVDVVHFDQLLASVQSHSHPSDQLCDDCLPLLNEAVQLYAGDFLAGFTLADSPGFDEWQAFESERLRLAFAGVLARLGNAYRERGEYAPAIDYARRWVAFDSLQEPAHRLLMQLYAENDQLSDALRQYELCRQVLQEQLGAPPAVETTALYEQIRGRQPGLVRPIRQPATLLRAPRQNLPTQTTLFIGREAEVAELKRLLLEQTGCRLLNLVGPGGIGKTRLAVATAAQTLDAFPDGAFFISLAPVNDVEFIVAAIAEALRFNFHGKSDPKDQLLDFLQQKQLLLLVDNFEHLLAGADLLAEILHWAPDVTILATARERLNLQEEWVYVVEGLSFPAPAEADAALTLDSSDYSAVALFVQRARQAVNRFTPTAAEMAEIVRICQLVEGMPLGLELAAPWIRSLTCAEIAKEIQNNLDFLTTPLRNVPERHRSLRAVFDQTWQRLPQTEQTVLRQLSVFRGGCTRDAAEQVTGATLPILSSLVDKALLRRSNTGRYEIHELIRQFAEAQLQIDPKAVDQIRQRHCDYFIMFLEARTAGVKGGRQREALFEIRADIDNVRLTWRRVVANRDTRSIGRAAECLFVYYLYTSGHYEGHIAFQLAATAFADFSDVLEERDAAREAYAVGYKQRLVSYLQIGYGYFLARTRDVKAGRVLLEQAVALLGGAKSRDMRQEGFALLMLGLVCIYQGEIAQGQEYAKASLALFSEVGDRWGEGWSLLVIGYSIAQGRPTEAEQALTKALAICRKSDDQAVMGYVLQDLSAMMIWLGRYTQAQQYIDEAFSAFEMIDFTLGLGYALQRQGQLAIAQGEYGKAAQVLERSTAYFNESRIPANVGDAQLLLGTAFRLQRNYAKAEPLYQQTLALMTGANHKVGIARCLTCLGCLAHNRDELHQAEQFLREALAIWQSITGQEAGTADVLRQLGQVLVSSGEHCHIEAKQYFRQALELAISYRLTPVALDVCVGVAQLQTQAGETERAIELLTLAVHHAASTFATKENARQLLVTTLNRMSPEAPQVAGLPERDRDLWAVVQELLTTLQRNDETISRYPGTPTPGGTHNMNLDKKVSRASYTAYGNR